MEVAHASAMDSRGFSGGRNAAASLVSLEELEAAGLQDGLRNMQDLKASCWVGAVLLNQALDASGAVQMSPQATWGAGYCSTVLLAREPTCMLFSLTARIPNTETREREGRRRRRKKKRRRENAGVRVILLVPQAQQKKKIDRDGQREREREREKKKNKMNVFGMITWLDRGNRST